MAMGGAAQGLGIEALTGEGDMVTVFDDFNGVVPTEGFGDAANWETLGWVLVELGATAPTGDQIGMQDPADVSEFYPSCIRIHPGTDADEGGMMQLDRINASLPASSGAGDFPHIVIPSVDAGTEVLDNTVYMFACRIGLRADVTTTGSGIWSGKAFIGWAENGLAAANSVVTPVGGALRVGAAAGAKVGFHIPEDGSIDGVSQRTETVAYAEGTNFTELMAANSVDGIVANGATVVGDTMWFDLALRMSITDGCRR
jgi:hypothetical protein